jgi:hypothetical protein
VGAGVGDGDELGVGAGAVGLGSGDSLTVGSGVGVEVLVGAATGAAVLGLALGDGSSSAATGRADRTDSDTAPDGAERLWAGPAESADPPSRDPVGLGVACETRMMWGRATVAVGVRCCARRA